MHYPYHIYPFTKQAQPDEQRSTRSFLAELWRGAEPWVALGAIGAGIGGFGGWGVGYFTSDGESKKILKSALIGTILGAIGLPAMTALGGYLSENFVRHWYRF